MKKGPVRSEASLQHNSEYALEAHAEPVQVRRVVAHSTPVQRKDANLGI